MKPGPAVADDAWAGSRPPTSDPTAPMASHARPAATVLIATSRPGPRVFRKSGPYGSEFHHATLYDACMRRASFTHMPCSIAQSLEIIGEWWTLLILRDAFLGVCRFDEFQSR